MCESKRVTGELGGGGVAVGRGECKGIETIFWEGRKKIMINRG